MEGAVQTPTGKVMRTCPYCGSTRMHRSRSWITQPWLAQVMRLLRLRRLYRCNNCTELFEDSMFPKHKTHA
jgi:DNA-directed RNA polymerase subunit RPC12/RpoP